jgi:hypothetical protein
MARRTARERLEIARKLSPVAVGLFLFCGITLQVAILWSGYWDGAPARTAVPVRPVAPVAIPERPPTRPAVQGSGAGDARSWRTGTPGEAVPSTGVIRAPDGGKDEPTDEPAARPAGRGPDGSEPARTPAINAGAFGRA